MVIRLPAGGGDAVAGTIAAGTGSVLWRAFSLLSIAVISRASSSARAVSKKSCVPCVPVGIFFGAMLGFFHVVRLVPVT